MKTLNYSIKIEASKEKVWDTMLKQETYTKWCEAFCKDAYYEGDWKQDTQIKFIDPKQGGTQAYLEEVSTHNRIHARHVAMVALDGTEDTESDMAKDWIGATETYTFSDSENGTKLDITMNTPEKYIKMFDECWPKALDILKKLCE